MSRSKSSGGWLQEHHADQYVKQSKADGYRSRASYKLLELDKKARLFRPGMTVVDLGSAPGGWSQVAADLVGHKGRVVASDILPMDSLAGVEFLQGDFTDEEIYQQLLNIINNSPVDLVISDMAPNMSGMRAVDQPKAMYLVELALDMAVKILKKDGAFVTKVFHGEGFDSFYEQCKQAFKIVNTRKPDSSRSRSRETYIVATGFKG